MSRQIPQKEKALFSGWRPLYISKATKEDPNSIEVSSSQSGSEITATINTGGATRVLQDGLIWTWPYQNHYSGDVNIPTILPAVSLAITNAPANGTNLLVGIGYRCVGYGWAYTAIDYSNVNGPRGYTRGSGFGAETGIADPIINGMFGQYLYGPSWASTGTQGFILNRAVFWPLSSSSTTATGGFTGRLFANGLRPDLVQMEAFVIVGSAGGVSIGETIGFKPALLRNSVSSYSIGA